MSWANKLDSSIVIQTAKFANIQGEINQHFDGINSWNEDVDQIRTNVQKFGIEIENLERKKVITNDIFWV